MADSRKVRIGKRTALLALLLLEAAFSSGCFVRIAGEQHPFDLAGDCDGDCNDTSDHGKPVMTRPTRAVIQGTVRTSSGAPWAEHSGTFCYNLQFASRETVNECQLVVTDAQGIFRWNKELKTLMGRKISVEESFVSLNVNGHEVLGHLDGHQWAAEPSNGLGNGLKDDFKDLHVKLSFVVPQALADAHAMQLVDVNVVSASAPLGSGSAALPSGRQSAKEYSQAGAAARTKADGMSAMGAR